MIIGALLIIVGTIIQGTSTGVDAFMGGRFLLGFGVSIAAAAGPMYVIEINHPAYRGVVGGMYNTLWFSGSIIASGAARGALNTGGNYSWRLITWLQILFSSLICIFAMFLPESPRWLYVNNKKEQARNMLTKYHGNGNPESAWVTLQMHEYEELLNMDGADKRWWDYRALFRNRASVYRMMCNIAISIFGQWAGNAVLSYFLGAVLDGAGYKNKVSRLGPKRGEAFGVPTMGPVLTQRTDYTGQHHPHQLVPAVHLCHLRRCSGGQVRYCPSVSMILAGA